jgi:NAD(P)-dependent dehydrogenase (short-subunit alcohol dehydrogenase family)
MGPESQLVGQTLLVIGGSSGIGLETARRAHAEGVRLVLTGRDPERVHRAGRELGGSIAAFDATDFDRLGRFFDELPTPIDHVLLTATGTHDASVAGSGGETTSRELDVHLALPIRVAHEAARSVRPGGTLLIMRCIGGGHEPGRSVMSALAASLSIMTKHLAQELAPIRVNLILGAFVATPLPESRLDGRSSARNDELHTTLPVQRRVAPADAAALAVDLMTNTAVTAGTFEIGLLHQRKPRPRAGPGSGPGGARAPSTPSNGEAVDRSGLWRDERD